MIIPQDCESVCEEDVVRSGLVPLLYDSEKFTILEGLLSEKALERDFNGKLDTLIFEGMVLDSADEQLEVSGMAKNNHDTSKNHDSVNILQVFSRGFYSECDSEHCITPFSKAAQQRQLLGVACHDGLSLIAAQKQGSISTVPLVQVAKKVESMSSITSLVGSFTAMSVTVSYFAVGTGLQFMKI